MNKLVSVLIFAILAVASNAEDPLVASTAEDPSAFVIGGRNAFLGQFPYMVSIRYGEELTHGCGGGIMNQRWVLSAAHCFISGFQREIMVGSVRVNQGGDRYPIAETIMHPLYPPTLDWLGHNYSNHHDIAVLRIGIPIQFNAFVQPIPLARSRVNGNVRATAAGFGAYDFNVITGEMLAPDHLQFISLQVITNLECTIRARVFGPLEPRMTTPIIYSGHICTQASRGRGVCFGDSGSMLITRDGVVGIVATTVLPCARGAPDVFIRVSSYLRWIDSYIHDL